MSAAATDAEVVEASLDQMSSGELKQLVADIAGSEDAEVHPDRLFPVPNRRAIRQLRRTYSRRGRSRLARKMRKRRTGGVK